MLLGSFENLRYNLLQWKRDKAVRLLAVHSLELGITSHLFPHTQLRGCPDTMPGMRQGVIPSQSGAGGFKEHPWAALCVLIAVAWASSAPEGGPAQEASAGSCLISSVYSRILISPGISRGSLGTNSKCWITARGQWMEVRSWFYGFSPCLSAQQAGKAAHRHPATSKPSQQGEPPRLNCRAPWYWGKPLQDRNGGKKPWRSWIDLICVLTKASWILWAWHPLRKKYPHSPQQYPKACHSNNQPVAH